MSVFVHHCTYFMFSNSFVLHSKQISALGAILQIFLLSVLHNLGNPISALNWKWIAIMVTILPVAVDHKYGVPNSTFKIESPPQHCDDKGTHWRYQNNPTLVITCMYKIAVLCLWFNFRWRGFVLKYQFTFQEATLKHSSWPASINGCHLLIISFSDDAALHKLQILSRIIKGSHNLSIISLQYYVMVLMTIVCI